MTFQSHLKRFRATEGLTQEDLAKAIGVTRQTIIAIEQAKYQPSLELAWNLAKHFNVSIESLFEFTP